MEQCIWGRKELALVASIFATVSGVIVEEWQPAGVSACIRCWLISP